MNFPEIIIEWYEKNKRDLPWRSTTDPYKIWLSEIILQQTRVNQGMPYYLKFTENFPDITSLADASEDRVLKLWQGLGYYSRARNLHATAKTIRDIYKGIFPSDPEKISRLKGVGSYTTAAIASFAFGHPLAVADGNVVRLLARYFNINVPFDSSEGKKIFASLAQTQLDKKNPATYNQAIMEFGSVQCKPQNPACDICPLMEGCAAYRWKIVDQLPVKKKQVTVKKRHFNYLVNNNPDLIFVRKREENDIWKNLFEFPVWESEGKMTKNHLKKKVKSEVSLAASYVHKLSHREVHADFWLVNELKIEYLSDTKIIKTDVKNLRSFPVSRLIERFIEEVLDGEENE